MLYNTDFDVVFFFVYVCTDIRDDFGVYAETLYQKFGDRVKHWITLNEPHTVAFSGYDIGIFAPGRCSILLHLFCRAGNSATEPYLAAHHLLLAHATAANIYRTKFQVLILVEQIRYVC